MNLRTVVHRQLREKIVCNEPTNRGTPAAERENPSFVMNLRTVVHLQLREKILCNEPTNRGTPAAERENPL
jgi:hypothetical protein